MGQEMHTRVWRKAIPETRDTTQSRALTWGMSLLLLGVSVDTLRWAVASGGRSQAFVIETFALSLAFALLVLGLRAATAWGATCGGMTCLLLTFWTGIWTSSILRSGLTPLVLLFLLTFVATRMGRRQKAKAGLAESRRGRSAAQVIANLSVAGICVSPAASWLFKGETFTSGSIWMVKVLALAALVEATADTMSSEIGQAFGGQPVMFTTLRRVAAGTDGAVTMLGSLAGLAGGAIVALAGTWAMHLSKSAAGVALVAGSCGLFFDSLIGATLERRGLLGNDLVNFTSTLFAAMLAAAGCQLLGHQ